MRCEEAKRRMIEGAEAPFKNSDLAKHLGECTECARYAETTQLLDKLLVDEAERDQSVISFSTVRDRVNMTAKQQSIREKIMSQIKDQYHARPRLMAGLGVAVAAFFFVVLVPFSFTHTVGWKASLEGIDANAAPSPKLLNAALATAGLDDVYVENISDDKTEGSLREILVRTRSSEEARQLTRAIIASATDDLVGELVQINVEPVIKIKSRTLLAQLYERVKVEEDPPVRIRFEEGMLLINGKGIFEILRSPELTDAEVKEEVLKVLKLKDKDDADVSVDVKTSDDLETRIVEIQATDVSLSHALSNIELHASDRVIGVKYNGDVKVPDSVAVVELKIPDSGDKITTKGVKIKVLIDLDEE
jgi:hypothetical protein